MSNFPIVPAPFFLVRFPMWPIEYYERFHTKESLFDCFDNDELFREAIYLASPQLYFSLKKERKDAGPLSLSLLKYAIRMTSRSTPFGLFSFVAKGSFSAETVLVVEEDKIEKRARPDLEWFYRLMNQAFEHKDMFPFLSIRTNPFIEQRGDRIFLTFSRGESEQALKKTSIRKSPIIDAIFSLTEKPILISQVCDKLKGFAAFDLNKTYGCIYRLLKEQFLLSGSLPSLITSVQENDSDILRDLKITPLLTDIKQDIKRYDKTDLGKGEASLIRLQQAMKRHVESTTYVQVDSFYNGPLALSKDIAEEIAHAVMMLWKISFSKPRSQILRAYHLRFVEKYGTHRTIPLLEMLHAEMGLGPMENGTMMQANLDKPSGFSMQWEKWLNRKWQECLKNNLEEIVITEELIDSLFAAAKEPLPSPEQLPPVFDIFCKILNTQKTDLDEDKVRYILTQPAWQGCGSIGRFLHLWGNEGVQECRNFLSQEEIAEKEDLFVEVSCWPSILHTANIAIQPSLRKWRLDLEENKKTKQSLSLKDIYVGASLDRFYLTLKKGGSEICAVTGNLLNSSLLPSSLIFILTATLDRYRLIHPFSWNALTDKAVFLPRVRFQNTLLSPATWNLDGSLFLQLIATEIIPVFLNWANEWKLPFRFLLVEGDQQLLLDRRISLHLKEIQKRLAQGQSLVLTEYVEGNCVEGMRGSYSSEFIIPFRKNLDKKPDQARSCIPLAHQSFPVKARWELPNNQWLYTKIYIETSGINRFLSEHIIPFAKMLQIHGIIKGFFFVRYYDSGSHLRIRWKAPSQQTLSMLNDAVFHWQETGLIKSMVIASYEKELERYGGVQYYGAIEQFFCADSASLEHLLPFLEEDAIYYQAASILMFLKDLHYNWVQMFSFLAAYSADRTELRGFRKYKQRLRGLIDSSNSPDLEMFLAASQVRREKASELWNLYKGTPTTWRNICHSLLHMHCNRLGCNLLEEKRSLLYAYQALQAHTYTSISKQPQEPVLSG